MERVRMSMHGFGYIGRIHVGALALAGTIPGEKASVEWQTACVRDLNGPPAADAEGFFQSVTDDWVEACASADAVDVVSPNDLHFAAVSTAIAKRKAVYCEKPLAHDIDLAREMLVRVERADVTNQVALIYRFHPAVEAAYHIIQSGILGPVLTFRAVLLHGSYLSPTRPISWRLRLQRSGAGALIDLGVHLFDLVHMLMGPTKSVQATLRTFVNARRPDTEVNEQTERVDVDDWASVQLQLASGPTGSVEVSRVHFGLEDAYCDIVCEKGTIHLPLHRQESAIVHGLGENTVSMQAVGEENEGPLPTTSIVTLDDIEPYRLPPKYATDPLLIGHAVGLRMFARRIQGVTVNYPVPTFREAYAAEVVVDAAKRAAASREEVIVGQA